ncbi:LacI family DNA-binding transcriptional regulator [Desemzia sp. FAM 23989]|uniref:LacI family DNA-binding transcriptional regulator n=1 Tax=Desemzia sp. FAM 23989 TaxID=3259523 RepID=UPI003887CCC4
MTNIQDIAQLAKVSSATVSRVINKNGYVSKETKRIVDQAIKELDYVPNSQAVSLKKGSTKTIGIVSTDFFDTATFLLRSFTLEAQKEGYSVTIFITSHDKQKELDALEMLKSKQLDGIFLLYRTNEWDVIEQYVKYGPIVTLNRVESAVIPSVYIDQYQGYLLGLEHLYQSGCRKIINLYSSELGLNTQTRIAVFKEFTDKYALESHDPTLFINLSGTKDGATAARWFDLQAEKPDAFMCASDSVAAGFVAEAMYLGYVAGKDYSIIGFDNIFLSEMLDITTIDYPVDLQAVNAFHLIYQRLTKKEQPLQSLDFKLIQRGSTKPLIH